MTDLFLNNRQLEQLDSKQKVEYFSRLKEFCVSEYSRKNRGLGYETVTKVYANLRNYDYEIVGLENIPKNGQAVYVCNHSNSHDILTAIEIFKNMGLNASVLVASDDLNVITRTIFRSCDAVLIDRRNKNSTEQGVYTLASNLISGMPVVIFGEGTWNLHPYKTMQQIKIGSAKISAIAEEPIIPTIFEYVEVPSICKKEKELYTKCIISFGKPIYIKRDISLISQTNKVQKILENRRLQIWRQLETMKTSLKQVKSELYLNHTYLKKFDGLGYTYDSKAESEFLFSMDGKNVANEFCLDIYGNLIPGITEKEEGKKYIKK